MDASRSVGPRRTSLVMVGVLAAAALAGCGHVAVCDSDNPCPQGSSCHSGVCQLLARADLGEERDVSPADGGGQTAPDTGPFAPDAGDGGLTSPDGEPAAGGGTGSDTGLPAPDGGGGPVAPLRLVAVTAQGGAGRTAGEHYRLLLLPGEPLGGFTLTGTSYVVHGGLVGMAGVGR